MLKKAVFYLMILIFAGLGFVAGFYIIDQGFIAVPESLNQVRLGIIALSVLAGAGIGIILTPSIIKGMVWFAMRLEQYLHKLPVQDLVMGSIGLIIGLIIANLLGSVFNFMGFIGDTLWILATILLGYLGMSLAVKKRQELLNLLYSLPKFGKDRIQRDELNKMEFQYCKVLDTSVIIDGRIADLCESGFIDGTLVVPDFVLDELRHIADSSDLLKRNRGRRGLDILNKMRKNMDIDIQIYNTGNLAKGDEVDTRLVKLAQKVNAKIMTNDFNLNKVAELHGVKVLNINDLANAVKPVVLPGEDMVVQIVKDGKETGQGVAYLDDGTMIVVDGGKKFIGRTVNVLVTSVLQTSAGRMIFAKPKPGKVSMSSASTVTR